MRRANLQKHRVAQWALTALAGAALTACGGSDAPTNDLPAGITQVSSTAYPATAAGQGDTAATQDLLTGGIGKTGLGLATAPAYADPANPTAAELRRNALYSHYRGILDGTTAGGYGSLYGPNVTAAGTVTTSEGLIPGREYVAVLDDGSGRKRTVIAVQVPDSFNPANPCVVLGASSGSRGVYGAIGTAGEWGLKKGCAVALTDAGKGVGIHDLTDDTVHKVDGTRATRTAAGSLSFFAANITESVYRRMESERKRVANELRSTGGAEGEKIRADADRQREIIVAEAYRDAQKIKGEGDAKASALYADAFGKDPQFAQFYRSLEAYRASFRSKSDVMVVDQSNEFFKNMRGNGTGAAR